MTTTPAAAAAVPEFAHGSGEHAAALARVTAFARMFEARNANGSRHPGAPLLAAGGLELRLEDLMRVAGIEPLPTCSCCRRLLSDPVHRNPNCATCDTLPAT